MLSQLRWSALVPLVCTSLLVLNNLFRNLPCSNTILTQQPPHHHDLSYYESSLLPKTLYVIYGLESSGTTFLAKTVANALDIDPVFDPDTVESKDHRRIHIQHLSLPLGVFAYGSWGYETRYSQPLEVLPVYYPTGCRVKTTFGQPPSMVDVPLECQSFLQRQRMRSSPSRYFVNISTHVQWYRNLGVKVVPIMVVRDPSFHFHGILQARPGHCRNETAAWLQYETGREILLQSMSSIHKGGGAGVDPIIVSYETLMTLQDDYLRTVLYPELNLTNATYLPRFRDGNLKHVSSSTTSSTTTATTTATAPNPTHQQKTKYIYQRLQKDGLGFVVKDYSDFPKSSRRVGARTFDNPDLEALRKTALARKKELLARTNNGRASYNPNINRNEAPKSIQLLMREAQERMEAKQHQL